MELAESGCLRVPGPLHVRALLHTRVPALARVQRGGGPRLQVHGSDQVGLAEGVGGRIATVYSIC